MLNPYAYDGVSPVLKHEAPGFQFDSAYGVDYEIDLSRPEGSRVLNLRWKGKPLDPNQKLKVVANSYRLAGGGDYVTLRRARRIWHIDHTMPDLLARWVAAKKTLDARGEVTWTLLPDYAGAPERPLIDRLVRFGVAPKPEVQRLGAAKWARRVDLVYWLGRAFDIRSARPSGAWPDVPESLSVWLDGMLHKGILGPLATADRFDAYQPATIGMAADWCERTARSERYALASGKSGDAAFRKSLFAGV